MRRGAVGAKVRVIGLSVFPELGLWLPRYLSTAKS